MNLLRYNSTISLLWTSFSRMLQRNFVANEQLWKRKAGFRKGVQTRLWNFKTTLMKKSWSTNSWRERRKNNKFENDVLTAFPRCYLKAKLRLNEWKNEWIVKQLYFRIAHFWNSKQVKISMKLYILWRTVNKKCCIVLKEYFLSRINFLSLS